MDVHVHVGPERRYFARAVRILDRAGVGRAVHLDGGLVTRDREGKETSAAERSQLAHNLQLARSVQHGRFLTFMNLDWHGWDHPDFPAMAVRQVEEGARLGAVGLKIFKDLGLYLRDGRGELIRIDDPRLDPLWTRLGELGMPVAIHTGDPRAFWQPYDRNNERWNELASHPEWWFGDPRRFPQLDALLEARNRVIARHPQTTFVCVHFASSPEDVLAVDRWLDRYPNMMVDLAARVPELGRRDVDEVRAVFVKHQDRILFGTDFMVYDKLILGSGGDHERPDESDADAFYRTHWRWLETRDREFAHMTPIQGDWTIDAVGLPPAVLRKIYFENARRLLRL